jgi:hypothetical protein
MSATLEAMQKTFAPRPKLTRVTVSRSLRPEPTHQPLGLQVRNHKLA